MLQRTLPRRQCFLCGSRYDPILTRGTWNCKVDLLRFFSPTSLKNARSRFIRLDHVESREELIRISTHPLILVTADELTNRNTEAVVMKGSTEEELAMFEFKNALGQSIEFDTKSHYLSLMADNNVKVFLATDYKYSNENKKLYSDDPFCDYFDFFDLTLHPEDREKYLDNKPAVIQPFIAFAVLSQIELGKRKPVRV